MKDMYGILRNHFFFKFYNIVSNIKSDWSKVLKEEYPDHTRQKENKVFLIINQEKFL